MTEQSTDLRGRVESISKEMWEYVNQVYWRVKNDALEGKNWEIARYQDFLTNIISGSQ